jgi:hypothetical protein
MEKSKNNRESEIVMSIVKVIEVLAESNKSWEDAAQDAVSQASKTIKNIKTVYIKEMQAVVENDKIINYRLNAKISFVVE